VEVAARAVAGGIAQRNGQKPAAQNITLLHLFFDEGADPDDSRLNVRDLA
jgi:hypothetical protein